jgi:iron complex outermembrane recepter protein
MQDWQSTCLGRRTLPRDLSAGANNLFNRYPNQLNPALTAAYYAYDDNAGVVKYPTFSPFGIDGGFYYVRAGYRF